MPKKPKLDVSVEKNRLDKSEDTIKNSRRDYMALVDCLNNACENGDLTAYDRLVVILKQDKLKSIYYLFFPYTYVSPKFALWIAGMCVGNLEKTLAYSLLESSSFEAFYLACSNGHLSIAEKLLELAPDLNARVKMFKAKGCKVISNALKNVNIDILELFIDFIFISPRRGGLLSLVQTRNHFNIIDEFEMPIIKKMLEVLVSSGRYKFRTFVVYDTGYFKDSIHRGGYWKFALELAIKYTNYKLIDTMMEDVFADNNESTKHISQTEFLYQFLMACFTAPNAYSICRLDIFNKALEYPDIVQNIIKERAESLCVANS